jgi:replicative DNA helicase
MHKTPVPQEQVPQAPFPFGPEFQLKLLKLLLVDDGTVDVVLHHLKPQFFSTPDMRWTFSEIWTYWAHYGRVPTLDVLRHLAQQKGEQLTPTILLLVDQLQHTGLSDHEWLKEQLVDWARANHFYATFKDAQALWNHGKRQEAMDFMHHRMDQLQEVMWKHKERSFLAKELSQRQQLREKKFQEYGETGDAISTGIPDLDKVMGGGLSPGELGIWIAYAKGGKSTMLLNHAAVAASLYKRVVHFVLEGSTQQVQDRYDAFFARRDYWAVKTGQMDKQAYKDLFHYYQTIVRDHLVVIGLLEKFDYTILDINSELQQLRRSHGWSPDLIIIDYGDLLRGRHGPYKAGWESEVDAFRDMKLLANRGYAVWTASQARRPDTKNYDTNQHLLKTAQVAGAIEKARVTDFIGSLNATQEEKEYGWLRIFAELYRDNQAGKVISVATEPSQMRFVGVQKDPPSDHVHHGPGVQPAPVPMGYVPTPES